MYIRQLITGLSLMWLGLGIALGAILLEHLGIRWTAGLAILITALGILVTDRSRPRGGSR